MSEYLVITTSLRTDSLSRKLAALALADYRALGVAAELIDLREFPLPHCDGEAAYADPNVGKLAARIQAARVIVIATPIYNYDANSAAKNLVELTGKAWEDKTVGFLCAAGGGGSYMSIMGLANSLMLDFRCLIIPRFVYATGDDCTADGAPKSAIEKRLRQFAESSLAIRNAV